MPYHNNTVTDVCSIVVDKMDMEQVTGVIETWDLISDVCIPSRAPALLASDAMTLTQRAVCELQVLIASGVQERWLAACTRPPCPTIIIPSQMYVPLSLSRWIWNN